MKIVLITLFVLTFAISNGQSKNKSVKNQYLNPKLLLSVENEPYQITRNNNKDTIAQVVDWDEFNEDSEERVSIPDEVFIKTIFHIDSDWAGEKIPLQNVFFKISIQLIYGEAAIGDNICNPIKGKELTLLRGSFTGKDLEKTLLSNGDYSGILYQTPRFRIREYLKKNNIRLFSSEGKKYIFGRITIRTYFGSSKERMNVIYEKVKNVLKNHNKN